MQLKSLKLHNIRSYKSEHVEFPKGSLLLSGDIGAGKSTILFAIEFALFGVRKPQLTGATLLRKGTNKGSVELFFKVDGKQVLIKRSLKKGQDIKQESGFIIIDGVKKEATPVELKSIILDLLGYPKNLLTKHKDLIYRYTVYTPQEEMKAILFEEKEARLNTLRKVFGIDKYKQARENCSIYIRALKGRIERLSGMIYDLTEKQVLLKEKDDELKRITKQLKDFLPDVLAANKKVKEMETLLKELEIQAEGIIKARNEIAVLEQGLKNILENHKKNSQERKKLNHELETLREELKDKVCDDFSGKLKEFEQKETKLQERLLDKTSMSRELSEKKSASMDILQRIKELDICPTCEQAVTTEHKNKVSRLEDGKVAQINEKLALVLEEIGKAKKSLADTKEELSRLRVFEKESAVIALKRRTFKDKEGRLQIIQTEQADMKKELGEINTKKLCLSKEAKDGSNVEERFRNQKAKLDMAREAERVLELKIARIEKDIENIEQSVNLIRKEVLEKQDAKKKIIRLSGLQNWLEEYFLNLMATMEKHVMSRLYREFNESFSSWFGTLIEDETILARLDDEFSPIIEQNGYETGLVNLSGGERTSVALAYRLALNKVINDYIHQIKTKDIIILDEPTDGFSHVQLDRVRVLLDEAGFGQVIIVSHEAKIESFVDTVIHVSKRDHVSQLLKHI